ncbi:SAM-dependent methyltransferase [Soehngenia saccharolytica]|nr:SAM-dependent methyltransferase [Soehngenia saccharolytica]
MTAAALVTQGYTLADVGTDHGYIPIYLLQQKKIPAAIAMDINEGPLERAKEHIALYGLQAYIQTRLSDGVAALKPGEVEAVLIAGMAVRPQIKFFTLSKRRPWKQKLQSICALRIWRREGQEQEIFAGKAKRGIFFRQASLVSWRKGPGISGRVSGGRLRVRPPGARKACGVSAI